MKERYSKPEMEIVAFTAEDIITTSGACGKDCRGNCSFVCANDCIKNTGCNSNTCVGDTAQS